MSKIPYIRVGTVYYKIVSPPTLNGDFSESLAVWSIEAIKQDEGRDYVSQIPKYDGFTCIPSHTNYQDVIGTFYNTYFPLSRKPIQGNCDTTITFLTHIFGKQLELGLDYLQLIYTRPTQVLPILCLVSKERQTGKSTFLKWLKMLFEHNMTYVQNESFTNQFNADWVNKLLICIDEVLFNKEELTERIKYLSTTNINKLEAKGKDRREIEFFGKFILCSNNEVSFIKIDADEIRFWVIKVPSIQNLDVDLLDKLSGEISAFFHFLLNRTLSVSVPMSRMWFSAKQIETPALRKLIRANRCKIEAELAGLLLSVMDRFDWTEINITSLDVLPLLSHIKIRTTSNDVRDILKRNWRLKPQSNSNAYEKVNQYYGGDYFTTQGRGRFYTVKKDFLLENFDEMMTE